MTFPPIYCIVGNNSLVPGFKHQMNKYWPQAKVFYLYYGDLEVEHSIKLGRNVPEENHWSDALCEFFWTVPHDYFGIMLEDYWLIKPVNHEMVAWMYESCRHSWAAKCDLHVGVKSLAHKHVNMTPAGPYGIHWVELVQDERYRTSLHLNLWRKDYFLKLLRPGQSPWSFELDNPSCLNDGEHIFGTLECPVDYCNLMRRNSLCHKEFQKIPRTDLLEMESKGIYVP